MHLTADTKLAIARLAALLAGLAWLAALQRRVDDIDLILEGHLVAHERVHLP